MASEIPGQEAASQGEAPAQEGAESGQDQMMSLITNASQALSMLAEVMGAVSPEAGQQMAAIGDQFKSVVEKAMGGAGPEGGASPAGGMSPPEAAGAGSASPAGMARGY